MTEVTTNDKIKTEMRHFVNALNIESLSNEKIISCPTCGCADKWQINNFNLVLCTKCLRWYDKRGRKDEF